MKKILTVLGIFLVLGFVFTGVDVASAAETCIVGPLRVSTAPVYATYGDDNVISGHRSVTDRVSAAPMFKRHGDNELVRPKVRKAVRVSTPPKMVGTVEQSKYILPKTTC